MQAYRPLGCPILLSRCVADGEAKCPVNTGVPERLRDAHQRAGAQERQRRRRKLAVAPARGTAPDREAGGRPLL